MSDNIDTIRSELWAKMRKSKKYRDNFVFAHLSSNTAAQVQTIREEQGLSQSKLAKVAGMDQARISVLEDPSNDDFRISTLRRVASALDVALIIRFVPFSELVNWVAELTPEKMRCPTFSQDSLNRPALVLGEAFTGEPTRQPNPQLVTTAQRVAEPRVYSQRQPMPHQLVPV